MSKRPWSSGHRSALPPAKRLRQQQQRLQVRRGRPRRRRRRSRRSLPGRHAPGRPPGGGAPAPVGLRRPRHQDPGVRPREGSPAIPGFDTSTTAVVACPLPDTTRGLRDKPFYASLAGDRLFVMAYRHVEELGPRPPPDDDRPPPAWSWSGIIDDDDAAPPFCPEYVTCHARHPDGRTVFASVMGWRPGTGSAQRRPEDRQRSTYAFHADRRGFRYHGEWLLPFIGEAHYDGELDAWVGLSEEAHYDGELDAWVGLSEEAPGRVASCDVPSRRAEPAGEASDGPDWKLSEERLFDLDFESAGHLGTTLLYMGGGSRYCLVQCCAQRGDGDDDPRCRRRVVRMTAFALKYGKRGELRITGCGGRASMAYTVAHDMNPPTLSPTAFWM